MTTVLSTSEKETIAGRARTLQERLDTPATAGEQEVNAGEWMDEWRDRVADGNKTHFDERLERVGLSRTDCHNRLQTHGWPAADDLPGWVHRLDDLLQFVEAQPSAEIDRPTDDERPFTHVLTLFVDYASERLDQAVLSKHLSDTALADMKADLHDRLELFCAHPLFIEFKTFVARQNEALVFGDDPSDPDNPQRYYGEFIEAIRTGELKAFFTEYAFLARLVETHIDQWVDAVEEFCRRLDQDYDRLVATFGDGDELGHITTIDAHGDFHHGGRRVFCLTFESGQHIVYKTRNMKIEAAFTDLLSWVNETSGLSSFKTIDYCLQEGYGWTEWIEPIPCAGEADVERYYRRAGALVCLLYATEFSDGHLDNVIAVGDQPVVIDLETLAQPKPAVDNLPIDGDLRHVIYNSVLRTGLVPTYRPESDVTDNSGFGSHTMTTEAEVRSFQRINTDLMDLTYQNGTTLEADNLPTLDGTVVEPEEYVDEITSGFEEIYHVLQKHTQTLLREEGPLARMTAAEVRYVFRPTDNYARIIAMMTTPAYLRTGLKFGCKVEALAKPLITTAETDAVWPLYESERNALRNGDIPRLSTTTESTALSVEDRTVTEFFKETALDRVQHRITTLSETDHQEQQQYLTWGYGSYRHGRDRSESAGVIDNGCEDSLVEEDAYRSACNIFDRIKTNAKYSQDGEPIWFHRTLGPDGGLHVHASKPGLYAGRMGIALFCAALDTMADGNRYREFVEEVVSPIGDATDSNETLLRHGIGGGAGLGSMVYGFTKLGTLLDDDRYFEIANDYLSLLTPARIAADDRYDVIDGSAGAVLGLLALHDATGNDRAIERAVTTGDHLLSNSSACDGIPTWQPATVERALTGFAHGTAGIAYALLRLADATYIDRFRETALASLAYEAHHYDADQQNWYDLRADAESTCMDAWCHGRSGIGLARLGMAEIEETERIRDDLTQALASVEMTLAADDHVCCGTYSRVALLLRAARTCNESAYYERATQLLATSIQRADTQGQFPTKWQTNHWYDPGFFQGEAGIGYTLLRWIDPSLPCVLLWK